MWSAVCKCQTPNIIDLTVVSSQNTCSVTLRHLYPTLTFVCSAVNSLFTVIFLRENVFLGGEGGGGGRLTTHIGANQLKVGDLQARC